jgi:hypothetical protein
MNPGSLQTIGGAARWPLTVRSTISLPRCIIYY